MGIVRWDIQFREREQLDRRRLKRVSQLRRLGAAPIEAGFRRRSMNLSSSLPHSALGLRDEDLSRAPMRIQRLMSPFDSDWLSPPTPQPGVSGQDRVIQGLPGALDPHSLEWMLEPIEPLAPRAPLQMTNEHSVGPNQRQWFSQLLSQLHRNSGPDSGR